MASAAPEATRRADVQSGQMYGRLKIQDVEDPAIRLQLEQQAQSAADLLTKLTATGKGDGATAAAMPKAVLMASEGLAFVSLSKMGLGLSYAQGDGFVIHKLDQNASGSTIWSAPIFFKVLQLGLGLTAGYQHTSSCIALLNCHSFHSFTREHLSMGTDLFLFTTDGAMAGVPAGTFGPDQRLDVSADRHTVSFSYSRNQGLLLDASLHGTFTRPDAALNEHLYGPCTAYEDVLAGRAPVPRAMLTLYQRIVDLSRQALC